ncbi:MAG: hypothetical protein Q9166_004039 [cf. Caloplaca sp. 2 TL-2023]
MASPELPFGTWRLRDVPASFDMEKFRNIIPLSESERVLYSSLAPDRYNNASTKVGTIIWNCVPKYLQQPASPDILRVRLDVHPVSGDDIVTGPEQDIAQADSKFIGLTPLNVETEHVDSVYVIAVTGVGGKPFMS